MIIVKGNTVYMPILRLLNGLIMHNVPNEHGIKCGRSIILITVTVKGINTKFFKKLINIKI